MASIGHLARRFVGSLSRQPPSAADEGWVRGCLADAEWVLWAQMTPADRRHAVLVAKRFGERRPSATRTEMAGALLHDVGKIDAGLGTLARVVATMVGPRTDRFRRYHDHERIGAALLEAAGSDPVTVALVRGSGDAFADLCAADDI